MQRTEGWETELWRVTAAAVETPHAWGTHDCAIFAADCVLAMTGTDLADGFRGAYASEAEAMAIIAAAGADTLGDYAGLHLPEIPVREARRGDVVACQSPTGAEFLAIVEGRVCLAPGPSGLVHVPRRQARRAFRVGGTHG